MGNLSKVLLLASVCAAASGCKDEPKTEGCSGGLCVEIYNSYFTEEACIDDPSDTCKFANVYFVVKDGDDNVTELDDNDLDLTISDRKVGVEGAAALTTSNALLVDLLLDRSYSLTESNSTTAVLDGARSFVESLPEEALINLSVFASETEVPTFIGAGGAQSTSQGTYLPKSEAAALITTGYQPYPKVNSQSQTKLYDAIGRLADFGPTEGSVFQGVMVVFTDGTDTASTYFTDPRAVSERLRHASFQRKVYAIALGEEINEEALTEISDGRFFSAADPDSLDAAFDEVAEDLSAIYLFKVLVATIEDGAGAELSVKYDGRTVKRRFNMSYSYFEPVDPGPGPNGCSNSCQYANDGTCDDGRPGATYSLCTLGTDCGDCGPIGENPQPSECSNICQYANDGACDDGRPGASYSLCTLGTDCSDCGPVGQTPIPSTCTNTCQYAFDGACDDGRPGADYSLCAFGTDCSDCGA